MYTRVSVYSIGNVPKLITILVSDFVTLIVYFAQLQAPLAFFGTYYTMVQNNLIDAERMLDLVGGYIRPQLAPLN